MRKLQVSLTLLALALLAADAAKDDAVKKELAKLQGTWKITAGESEGTSMPEAFLEGGRWSLKDNTYSFELGDQSEQGKFKLDPSKMPATIDLEITAGNDKGKTQVGIYKLEGDTLTVCFAHPGDKERPTKFATKEGTDQLMFVFKRDKP